jgi:outer membrane receptor protein involved in Fe transport
MSRSSKWALSIITALWVSPLAAQNFGEITGAVSDSSGAIITGASVAVIHTATNQVRQAITNRTGNYSVPYLAPGLYDVRAETPGFKTATRKGVDLQVGDVARIDFAMEVGDVTQQMEVTGGAPLIATETVALGTVIENRRIVDLPLNGRNYLQLVALSPNVTVEGGGGGGAFAQGGARSQTSISIAGQRLEFNRYTLDGVENTDPNFNSYITQPSIDAVQEFKVQSGVYSAEFGRGSSQINVTTKSGSNQYHATVFEFLRNSAMDARQWLQSTGQKNPFRRNQYGFTLGGPVQIPKLFNGRDRLFFMSNFEKLQHRKTTEVSASVAPVAMRNGDFSAAGSPIFDPLSRTFNSSGIAVSATQFPDNVIPASRFDPASLKTLNFYPTPNQPGTSLVRNYLRNAAAPYDTDQFTQRIDWIENGKSSWFGRYTWNDDSQTSASTFLTDDQTVATTARQGMLSNTRILSASMVNEARFAWTQFHNDSLRYFGNKTNVQAELAIPGLFAASPAAYGVPAIGLGGGISGFGGGDPFVGRDDTFQWMDNLSLIRGKHSIKFGGEFRRDRYNEIGNQKSFGEFLFDGQSTFNPASRSKSGFIFADFMLGATSSAARVLALANAMLRRSAYAGYIQDDWKITPKLTLNVGLRYENTRPWEDKYRGMMNLQLFDKGALPGGAGLLPNSRTPIITRPGTGDFYEGLNFHFATGQLTQVGNQFMGRGLVNPDNSNFAPRLGLSYSPTDHWTFRAGVGVFFVQDIGNMYYDMSRNLAGRDLYQPSIETRTARLSNPWAEEAASANCPGWTGTCLVQPQFLAQMQDNRTPYVEQWLFNIQRQITQNLVLEVGYQGNEGHKLVRASWHNEPVLKTGPNDPRTIAQRLPWPAYGKIMEYIGAINSNYNGLSAKLTQRFSKGLTYLIGFTWSKAIDENSAARVNNGDQLEPINPYNFMSGERGLSQFNVGRRFVGSYLYELPFGQGKSLLSQGVISRIVGGWQLSGIFTLADGTPVSVSQIADTASLNATNRPDATGISPIPAHQSAQQFWNVAAFNASSPNLTWLPGNAGRNTLITPGTRNVDLSLARNIRLRENHSLNFRFETFNSTNHPNWNAPAADARSASTFGVVTSAKTMRELQLGLKYVF